MDIQINDKVVALKTITCSTTPEGSHSICANPGDILVVKHMYAFNRYLLRVVSEHSPNRKFAVGLKDVRKLGTIVAKSHTIFIEHINIDGIDYFYLWMPNHKHLLRNDDVCPLRFISLNSAKIGAERRVNKTLTWN